MPTINLTGQRGSQPGKPGNAAVASSLPPGPRSQIPFTRPEINAAFEKREAQQRAAQNHGKDIYDRALEQQTKQIQKQVNTEIQLRKQLNSEIGKRIAAEAKATKALDAVTAREIRENESERKRLERERTRALRINDRARERRANNENRIMRADADQENRLRDRLDPNTYRRQNINRMGFMGQRAADSQNWKELVRIERELKRIEKVNNDQLKVSKTSTAAEKAAAERNLAALRQARTRIGVGKEGSSGLLKKFSMARAAAELAIAQPELAIPLAAIGAVAEAPQMIASTEGRIMSASRPYMNFVRGTSTFGRAGGFNSADLRSILHPTSGVAPAWMKRYGFTPEAALGVLGAYGVPVQSAGEARDLLGLIGHTQFARGVGLSAERLAQSAGLARELGIIPDSMRSGMASVPGHPSETYNVGAARYFQQLQKVMVFATREGLDQSHAISNVEKLLQASAAAGGLPSMRAARSFYTSLVGTGNAAMRAGAGVASLSGALGGASGSLGYGGPVMLNNALMSRFNTSGWPTTEDGLRQSLGISKDAWNKMDSANKRNVQDYLTAMKNGDKMAALTYYGQLSQLNEDSKASLYNAVYSSPVVQRLPEQQRAAATANLIGNGVTVTQIQAARAAGLGSVSGAQRDFAQQAYSFFRQKGYSDAAAKALVANDIAESGGDASRRNAAGMYGLAQWDGHRRALFQKAMGHSIYGSTPQEQLQFQAWELAHTERATGDRIRGATNVSVATDIVGSGYERYGNHPAEAARRRRIARALRVKAYTSTGGQLGSEYTATDEANRPSAVNASESNYGQAGLTASEEVFKALGNKIGGALGDAAGAASALATHAVAAATNIDALSDAAKRAAAVLNKISKGMGPGSTYVSPSTDSRMLSLP